MKDFIKWLGNNEKVGKVIVWLLIIIIALIILNTTLMSLGLPHYQITEKNIVNINVSNILNMLTSGIISILNFYAIIFLIFSVNKHKKLIKFAILYVVLAFIVYKFTGYVGTQIYYIVYILGFCYKFSNKNKRYILYGIFSYIINALVQLLCYEYKFQFIDMTKISHATRLILSLDYFIIMGIIILVKEIYIRKRGGKNGKWNTKHPMDRTIQQRKDICKETSKKSIKSSKITNKEVVSTKK